MNKFEGELPDHKNKEAGLITQLLAQHDFKKAARNNTRGFAYDVPTVSSISGEPVEGHGDKFVVFPSKWGKLETYRTPDGSVNVFRSRSKVHHRFIEPGSSVLVARTPIGKAEGFKQIK